MRYGNLFLSTIFLFTFGASEAIGFSDCNSKWKSHAENTFCELVPVQVEVEYPFSKVIHPFSKRGKFQIQSRVRAGYIPESKDTNFKGNIVYLQGLGDSIQNHDPLFSKLTEAGYRVIAFDYMGQGGSEGSMNDTRISDIANIGFQVFQKYGRDLKQFPKPILVGWSTGALAAYLAVQKGLAKAVVLIAPGIVPNWLVGEQSYLRFKFNRITLESLTTDRYTTGNYNPHVDPIKPSSPLDVKDFALNLQGTAAWVTRPDFIISRSVKGFVLLSGADDTYVDASATKVVLQNSAPHFQVTQYGGTLHEIDNEFPGMRSLVQRDILYFLSTVSNSTN